MFRLEQLIQWETSVLSSPDGMKTGLMKVETAFFSVPMNLSTSKIRLENLLLLVHTLSRNWTMIIVI